MRYRHLGVRSNIVMSLAAPGFGWQVTRTTVVLSEPGWRPDTDVYRAGVSTVILPRHNERDVEDVPAEARQALRFVFVDTAEQVLEEALTRTSGAGAAHAA